MSAVAIDIQWGHKADIPSGMGIQLQAGIEKLDYSESVRNRTSEAVNRDIP
jgi:hypothetical protein